MEINKNFSSIEQVTGQFLNSKVSTNKSLQNQNVSFEELLKKKQEGLEELKFSKHADGRLQSRNITLTENQKQRLEDGAKKARGKGIQESLVLIDQLAFIVNVKNNTVITAMSQDETNETIFTNIDGAVII